MNHISELIKNTMIMTAVNLATRSAGVGFNSYLASKIGPDGIGLFQLVSTVYSLAVTFSSAGVRLACSRVCAEAAVLNKNDAVKSLEVCIIYACCCGCVFGIALFSLSDVVSLYWLSSVQTAPSLRALALSLPFVAMSSALGGYFTAVGLITKYSLTQTFEQSVKIVASILLINGISKRGAMYSCAAAATGITLSEIASFSASLLLKTISAPPKSDKPAAPLKKILRISIPDASGTCVRSALLTVEHLLIPRGFKKSGSGSAAALADYGLIHAMATPLLLYPSAFTASLAALLIPELAKRNELGDGPGVDATVKRNLKRTFVFSLVCSAFFGIFASPLSKLVYKTGGIAKYVRLLSPLVPVMYMDSITDGMLKGLDQQLYSMRYNIIDSSLCVILVLILLPKYAVKGYVMIMYISEIINFYLSFGRLVTVCNITVFPKKKTAAAAGPRFKPFLQVGRSGLTRQGKGNITDAMKLKSRL